MHVYEHLKYYLQIFLTIGGSLNKEMITIKDCDDKASEGMFIGVTIEGKSVAVRREKLNISTAEVIWYDVSALEDRDGRRIDLQLLGFLIDEDTGLCWTIT